MLVNLIKKLVLKAIANGGGDIQLLNVKKYGKGYHVDIFVWDEVHHEYIENNLDLAWLIRQLDGTIKHDHKDELLVEIINETKPEGFKITPGEDILDVYLGKDKRFPTIDDYINYQEHLNK